MVDLVNKPTIRVLLKQVYALHTEIVRDLEDKLNSQENNSKTCPECDELRKALAECRGSYYDALQHQKQQIDVLDKRLSAVKLFESSKNTRNVGIQTTDDLQTSNLAASLHIGSDSRSSCSRPRKRLSNEPLESAFKKVCLETASDASSTLLKNDSPGKTLRLDFLPFSKTRNSLEPEEHQMVLAPESPQSEISTGDKRKVEFEDEIIILDSHKKVTTWLENMEMVPETVPLTTEQILLPVSTETKTSPSVISFGSENESVHADKNLSSVLPTDTDRAVEPETEKRNSSFLVADGNSKKATEVEREPVSKIPLEESNRLSVLNCQPVSIRRSPRKSVSNMSNPKNSSKKDNNKTGSLLPLLGVSLGSTSKKPKAEEGWLRSGKKVLRQSKLKLKKIDKTKESTMTQESLDLDATMLPTKMAETDPDHCLVARKERILCYPEDKENIGTEYLECDDGSVVSEDLLANSKGPSASNLEKENGEKPELMTAVPDVNDSFDIVPCKEDKVAYKVKEATVRDRASRNKMPGHECESCLKYYENLELPEEERKERLQLCSKHRSNNALPTTPEHYWEIGFPDTPECQERGYVNVTQKVQLRPRRRRPLK